LKCWKRKRTLAAVIKNHGMNIEPLFNELSRLIRKKSPAFNHGVIRFVASSSVGMALKLDQELYDADNKSLDVIMEFGGTADPAFEFFMHINESGKYNILEFTFTAPSVYTYRFYWDQSVQDEFDSYLPENLKGTFTPWYSPLSEHKERFLREIADNKLLEAQYAKRWQPIGELLEEFEIQYLSPTHHGYPQWAGDRYLQLWCTHWNTYIVCTRGLYEAGNKLSLGFELYFETKEQPESFDESWQANIVYEIGKILPKVTDLKQRFEASKYLSVKIAMEGAPEDWRLDGQDFIGVMLGIEHNEFQQRNYQFPFRPVNVKLLRPAEMRMFKKLNAKGQQKLVNFYHQRGNATVSSLTRPSALKEE
jgi:hypothetical protein